MILSPKLNNTLDLNIVKEVKGFLGMSNYYREFVPKYAEMAEPLQELERTSILYVREKAFESIKQSIASGYSLNFPNCSKPFLRELDGSETAACRVLMQKEGNGKKGLVQICKSGVFYSNGIPTSSSTQVGENIATQYYFKSIILADSIIK